MEWKLELNERLKREKCEKIQRENEEEERFRQKNMESWKKEAYELFLEIASVEIDPSDKWQYKKGLRLAYLGTLIGNEAYKEIGLEFYRNCCPEL